MYSSMIIKYIFDNVLLSKSSLSNYQRHLDTNIVGYSILSAESFCSDHNEEKKYRIARHFAFIRKCQNSAQIPIIMNISFTLSEFLLTRNVRKNLQWKLFLLHVNVILNQHNSLGTVFHLYYHYILQYFPLWRITR